jgi:hypothetical protein
MVAKYHVTLQAELSRGVLYWVSDVTAGDEDDALRQAEAIFLKELETPEEWSFTAGDVEAL